MYRKCFVPAIWPPDAYKNNCVKTFVNKYLTDAQMAKSVLSSFIFIPDEVLQVQLQALFARVKVAVDTVFI